MASTRPATMTSSQFTYMAVAPMEPIDLEVRAKSPGYPVDLIVPAGNRPKWKPFVLKTPFLLVFFLATIVLIVVIEVLHAKSNRERGLSFANSLGDFTAWETFSYRYLMTAVSVLYGMAWAVVDLDIRRLEPFFQLALPTGATGKNSILLRYPFGFLAAVPVTAFGRRHWSVFCAGVALVLISWVITPMQAALLATKMVSVDVAAQFVPSKNLAPYESQLAGLEASSQYFFTAFGVTWLDEQLPPFTTTEYAATPFKPASGGLDRGTNESWTAVTRTYATDIDCTLGTSVSPTQPFNITNNAGCFIVVSPIPPFTGTRNIQYLGIGDWGGMAGWNLLSGTCDGGPHLFMGIWAEASEVWLSDSLLPPDTDISAVFCTPNYHYADSEITVDAETLLIKSIKYLGDPVPFTQDDGIIDIGRFETDLSTGQADVHAQQFISAVPPTGASRFQDWGLAQPTSQISYAIGLSPGRQFEDFKDPRILSEAFARAHKLLFAAFVSELHRDLPQEDSDKNPVLGNRRMTRLAVVVVGLFARLLEAFLAVVAACVAVLGILTYRRNASLFGDPDSIAARMAFVADSKALLQDFDGFDEYPDLQREIGSRTYRLDSWDSNGYYRIDSKGGLQTRTNTDSSTGSSGSNIEKKYSGVAARPFVLSTTVGVLLVLVLLGILGLLVFLHKCAQKYNGLPILSGNQVVVQIIFSVIPTAVVAGIEPLWVLLTRYTCAYQPYAEFAKGRAPPSKSLTLTYTNTPPALTLFRALRANHLIIFSLSAAALLANLLAVLFGGIFNSETRPFDTSTTFIQPLANTISTELVLQNITGDIVDYDGNFPTFVIDSQEPWIIAVANITQNTPLPPWVTPQYYFLPFKWKNSTNSSRVLKAITPGFGVDLDCLPLEDDSFKSQVYLSGGSAQNREPRFSINITLPIDGGRGVRCTSPEIGSASHMNGFGSPGQMAALEYMFRLTTSDKNADQVMNETCQNTLIVGWGRGLVGSNVNSGGGPFISPNSYKNVTLVCQQKLRSAMFEVTVDEDQRVQRFSKIAGSDKDPSELFRDTTTILNFTSQVATIIHLSASQGPRYGTEMYWHSNTAPRTVPHYLMEHLLNASFSDPSKPLASFNVLRDGYNQVFQRLFTIILRQNANRIFTQNPAGVAMLVDGFETTAVQRIAMDTTMFYISSAIIGFSIAAATLAYLLRPKNFLPRVPDTLASEVAYFYSSRALADVSGTVSMSSASRGKHLNRLGHEYGFGDFRGQDGKKHRGVERSSALEFE